MVFTILIASFWTALSKGLIFSLSVMNGFAPLSNKHLNKLNLPFFITIYNKVLPFSSFKLGQKFLIPSIVLKKISSSLNFVLSIALTGAKIWRFSSSNNNRLGEYLSSFISPSHSPFKFLTIQTQISVPLEINTCLRYGIKRILYATQMSIPQIISIDCLGMIIYLYVISSLVMFLSLLFTKTLRLTFSFICNSFSFLYFGYSLCITKRHITTIKYLYTEGA